MKRISVVLIATSIGVLTISGVTVGAAEVCANTSFDQVWMQKVRSYTHWNNDPKNAKYVKEHGLRTRDMSKQTASMKRAMKALEVMCGSISTLDYAASDWPVGGLVAGEPVLAVVLPQAGDGMDLEASQGLGQIASVDYPLYDNPSRIYSDDSGYGPGYSWFGGGGGYVGGRPSAPPVTPPVMTPVPEPSGLVLSAVPMLALIAARKRKK